MTPGAVFSPTTFFKAASTGLIPVVNRFSGKGGPDILQVRDLAGFQVTNKESTFLMISLHPGHPTELITTSGRVAMMDGRLFSFTLIFLALLSITILPVSAADPPNASFSAIPTSGSFPLTVSFTDSSTNSPTGWAWFFGDEDYSEPWIQVNASAGWLARWGLMSVSLPDGSIVMTGGYNGTSTFQNDTWRSTDYGSTWVQMNASSGWLPRQDHKMVALPDGSIVLMGGETSTGTYKNDTWRSTDNGITWTRLNASSGWTARKDSSSVVLPDGNIVLTGGWDSIGNMNDTWQSTDSGVTWTMVNASAGWTKRWGHVSVAMPDGSIVLTGGRDNSGYIHDVWRSTDSGATWNLVTANAGWIGRGYHTSVAMPDSSIVLMGGFDSDNNMHHDVWRSNDNGATWTQVNASPGWRKRSHHSAVAMPDGSIVLMGGNVQYVSYGNDVWRFSPAGSSVQNPSHTYTTAGTYNVSLQAYNANGYNSTQKAGYITVVESLVAGFTSDFNSGPLPLYVQFTDESTGSPTSWNWSFGDGMFSEEQNPLHKYTSTGSFDVSLNVTKGADYDIGEKGSYIDVTSSPLNNALDNNELTFSTSGDAFWDEDFVHFFSGYSSARSGTIGNNQFSSLDITVEGPVLIRYTWDVSSQEDHDFLKVYVDSSEYDSISGPSYGWTSYELVIGAGTHTISWVYEKDGDGITDGSDCGWVDDIQIVPSARFSANVTSGDVPLTVRFTDQSTGFPDSFAWDFGDGTTSTQQNPVHTYTSRGRYTVNLTVTNEWGSNSLRKGWLISALPPHSAASVHNLNKGTNYGTIQAAINEADVGDTIVIDSGTYQEHVKVNKSVTIRGEDTGYGLPVIDATYSSSAHGGSALNLSAGWTTVSDLYVIHYNSGYGAGLYVQSDNNVLRNVNALYNYKGVGVVWNNYRNTTIEHCNASFNDWLGYHFYMAEDVRISNSTATGNDGWGIRTDYSEGIQARHNFFSGNSVGGILTYYSPSAVTSDNTFINTVIGIAVSLSNNQVIRNNTMTVPGTIAISFESSNSALIENNTVQGLLIGIQMTNSSSNLVYNNFINTTEIYAREYSSSVNIWNTTRIAGTNIIGGPYLGGNYWGNYNGTDSNGDGIGDTFIPYTNLGNITIGGDWLPLTNVTGMLPPVANLNGTPTSGTAPLTVKFMDDSTNNPTIWNWSFGDSSLVNATVQDPIHTYTSAGTYTVSLNATNSAGSNTSTRTNYIVVSPPKPIPIFSANVTSGVLPLTVSFTDSSTNTPTGWAWFFGDETYKQAWTQINASAGWSARSSHSSVAMPDGSIVLMGGWSGTYKNDTWRSTDYGANWTLMNTSGGWRGSENHGSVVMPDGSIILMGGFDGSVLLNDVWRSTDKGATWVEMKPNDAIGWSKRSWQRCVVMSDGSIVLMGGSDGSNKNDVWNSSDNGATWTQVTAGAGWSGRYGHSSVAMPDGSIVLMGGYDGSYKNDTWRSTDNGATWTLVNTSAGWIARSSHSSVAMPDGSIVLMGGEDSSGITKDMWRSTDNGNVWTLVNESAGWNERRMHSSVALSDGSIVLMGGDNPTTKNDVWRFTPTGSSLQNPSHTYTAAGVFQVALQAFNNGGYNSTRKSGYITVTGSAPVASFTANVTSGTVPLTVTFTDSSTNTPTAWNWSFGDGTTSILQNPAHTYTTPGIYAVSLNATSAAGSSVLEKTAYIWADFANATMFRNNRQHTGVYSTGGIEPVNTVKWTFTTGGQVLSSPAVADGIVYVGSSDSRLYALYAGNGTKKWQYTTGNGVKSSPAVADGIVYFFSSDGYLRAVYSNGTLKWDKDLGGDASTGIHWRASPTVADGIVYQGASKVGSSTTAVYAVYADNGTVKWSFNADGDVQSAPAAYNGTVYIVSNRVYALNASTGAEKWNSSAYYGGPAGSLTVTDTDVYLGWSRSLTDLHASNGTTRWIAWFGAADVYSSPAIADEVLYVGCDDSKVYAVHAANGTIKWQTVVGAQVQSSPAVADGVVYVGSADDKLYALYANNGTFKWSYQTGGDVTSSPVIADGVIYVGSNDNKVYAFGYVTAPVAAFSANKTSGTAPLAVQFNDTSTNSPTAWNWSFKNVAGNNTQVWWSTARNATQTFGAGNFSIAVNASNSAGYSISTQVTFINVTATGLAPVANLNGTPTSGTAPLTVKFMDDSTNDPTIWNWSFGDGSLVNATVQDPIHTYTSAGNYTVSLNATNSWGSNTSTWTNYIKVNSSGSTPIANFAGTPTSGTAPLTVSFTDTSLNLPTGWSWFFGDENYTAPWTQQTASAGWTARDLHSSVSMPDGNIVMMGGADGGYPNDTWRSTNKGVTWTQLTSSAGWLGRDHLSSVVLPDGSIVMMGGTDGTFKNDVWRSTDKGATWTLQTASAGWTPRHSQNSVALGDGSIVLIGGVDGIGGIPAGWKTDVWRSTDKGVTWSLQTATAGWSARWGYSSVLMPDGSIVMMGGYDGSPKNDTWRSTDNGATWSRLNASAGWTARELHSSVAMPDGSIILMGGADSTSRKNDVWRSTDNGAIWVRVNSSAGWLGRQSHSSVPMPDGSILVMGGYSDTGRMNDVWRFVPYSSSLQNPSHTYTSAGTFQVAMLAFNDGRYNRTPKTGYITVNTGTPAPVASFTTNITNGTVPFAVQFTDTSTGSPTSWNWDFGDANTSTLQNPVYTFVLPQVFNVTLKATNSGGSHTSAVTQITGFGKKVETTTVINGTTESTVNGNQVLSVNTTTIESTGGSVNTTSTTVTITGGNTFWNNTQLFAENVALNTTTGDYTVTNMTQVVMQSAPVSVALNESVGTVSVSLDVALKQYVSDAPVNITITQGATTNTVNAFQLAAQDTGLSIKEIAYTVQFTNTQSINANLTQNTTRQSQSVILTMNVKHSWVARFANSTNNDGRDSIAILRYPETGDPKFLTTRFDHYDPVTGLDWFEADSPDGLSIFGMIGFAAQEASSSQSSGSSGTGSSDGGSYGGGSSGSSGAGKTDSKAAVKEGVSPQKAPHSSSQFFKETATLNPDKSGLLPAEIQVQSIDQVALITLPQGIQATDNTGQPLTEVSILPLDSSAVPPPDSRSPHPHKFTGLAYHLGPDGSRFSPSIDLTLTLTPDQWNNLHKNGWEPVVHVYSTSANGWEELPTKTETTAHIISTPIPHFSDFAVFSQPARNGTVSSVTSVQNVTAENAAKSPANAFEVIIGLGVWGSGLIINNPLMAIIGIIVIVIGYVGWAKYRKKKERDFIMYGRRK
ncbi:MAG: PKD domain-containing protein [Methanoregula sp.]|nr:PKD domain-containing protein [Methanoregula sp.]